MKYSISTLFSSNSNIPTFHAICQYSNLPDRSTLRASSYGNLIVTRTCQQIGDRAFPVAALRACNRLPTELKLLRSTDSFGRDLKTFLFYSVYFTGTRIRTDS